MRSYCQWFIGIVVALITTCSAGLAQDVAELAGRAASNDIAERSAAFEALRAMGTEGVTGLLRLLVAPEQGGDAGARIALHGLAVRLSSPGETEESRAQFAQAMANYLKSDAPTDCKQFVVIQLQIAGRAESVPALADLLADRDLAGDAVRALAVNPAPEAGAALRDALNSADGLTQVEIIQALGFRKDRAAVPQLVRVAESGSDSARAAAIGALGQIGDPSALKVLLAAMDREAQANYAILYDALLKIAENLVATGRASEARPVYLTLLESAKTPATRQAALVGLGKTGTADDVPVLVRLLTDPEEQTQRAVQEVLEAIDDERAPARIVEAARSADPPAKIALLGVLARRGEPEGRQAIELAASDEDINVRVRALELLDRLGDPDVRETLLEGARAGNEVALAAYIRQADAVRDGGQPDNARSMYLTALDLATTDRLRSLALYGLAGAADPVLLPTVQPFLTSEGTREAALQAYTAIALRVQEAGDPERAKQLLLHALELGPTRQLTTQIVGRLRDLGADVDPARAAGFISKWWVIGPFPGSNVDNEFPPEKGVHLTATVRVDDRELRWMEHHTMDPSGIVNYAAMMQPNTDSTAYMYAEISVDQAQDVLFKCGSDDGMKLWLNGRQIHRAPQPRSLRVDEDSVEAHLEAGVNRVLVKVVQGGGGWEACIRITDREGKALRFTQ